MNPFSKRGCSKNTSMNAVTCAPTAAGSTTAVQRRITPAASSFLTRSCPAAGGSPTRLAVSGCARGGAFSPRGGPARDHARGLELLDPLVHRGGREPHPLGDLGLRERSVLLHQRQDAAVGAVEFAGGEGSGDHVVSVFSAGWPFN